MTTVIYDGERLVADTMSMHVRNDENAPHCLKCGESTQKTHSYTKKLEMWPPGKRYDGQYIYAVAGYGNERASDAIKLMLKEGVEFDVGMTLLKSMIPSRVEMKGGVVALAAKGCYDIYMADWKIKITRIDKVPYAKGSGSKAALAVMSFLGVDAVIAIAMASTIDAATGGDIHSFGRDDTAITTTNIPEERIQELKIKREVPCNL